MKTKKQWMDHLCRESWHEALEAMLEQYPDDTQMSPEEVLGTIVTYKGGIACELEMMDLVNAIWNIRLQDIEVQW